MAQSAGHRAYLSRFGIEITPDITVYRYSSSHVVSYLKDKVLRLAQAEVFEGSQSLTRGLAKDGFLEDGKESLLSGEIHFHSQKSGSHGTSSSRSHTSGVRAGLSLHTEEHIRYLGFLI